VKKRTPPLGLNGFPVLSPEISVQSDLGSADGLSREARDNQSEVPGSSDHRMSSVGFALLRTARMSVHVGNHGQAPAFAQVPQTAAMTPVESDDPSIEAMRVEVIVENKIDNSSAPIRPATK
jgi:hypothetical protein